MTSATWREAMNADIKAYFDMPSDAEVLSLDTVSETRGYGSCSTCRWTVFIVKVEFRDNDGLRRTQTFEGSLAAFLDAVSEVGQEADGSGSDDMAQEEYPGYDRSGGY